MKIRSLPPQFGAAPSPFGAPRTAGTGFARQDGQSAASRGYDAAWRRVRREVLAKEPHCRACAAEGRQVPATDVDHVHAFRGLSDPRRLDPRNLRPLCRRHHMARTAEQSRGKG